MSKPGCLTPTEELERIPEHDQSWRNQAPNPAPTDDHIPRQHFRVVRRRLHGVEPAPALAEQTVQLDQGLARQQSAHETLEVGQSSFVEDSVGPTREPTRLPIADRPKAAWTRSDGQQAHEPQDVRRNLRKLVVLEPIHCVQEVGAVQSLEHLVRLRLDLIALARG
jgi:hypothetical protein